MARGDVLSVELPPPPSGEGREQAGRRPAIAVQSDIAGVRLPTLMVVPMTSQIKAAHFPYTIQVEPSRMNGLSRPSVLLVFQLRAIDQKRILRTLGRLEQVYLDQMDTMMRQMLGLG